jgi:predicted ester cyclase
MQALSAADRANSRKLELIMRSNEETLATNKAAVLRFNSQVIELGNEAAFRELMAQGFVNHSAPPGIDPGQAGMLSMFNQILRPAFPDLKVEIHDQVAEGDKVTTRKTIRGTHHGEFFGIRPTNRLVAIEVIDVVRLENGRYVEHWGVNTLPSVLAALRQSA